MRSSNTRLAGGVHGHVGRGRGLMLRGGDGDQVDGSGRSLTMKLAGADGGGDAKLPHDGH